MPQTLLTDLAEAKLSVASGDETAVAISEIALGDGAGSFYAPSYGQTSLVNERVRKPVEIRRLVEDRTWWVRAVFGAETEKFTVREIGFFDADGDLIAIHAGLDMPARQTGDFEYLAGHYLNFSRVQEGLLIVEAPDDVVWLTSLSQLRANFLIFTEQMRQARVLETLQA